LIIFFKYYFEENSKNEKINEFNLNQKNGIIDMNRDTNLKLIKFIEFEKDIINVFVNFQLFFFFRFFVLIKNSLNGNFIFYYKKGNGVYYDFFLFIDSFLLERNLTREIEFFLLLLLLLLLF
jgi:hypothetical protein